MAQYIGITIGPIHTAMEAAGKPAGLWAASFMFSKISQSICEKLIAGGLNQDKIVVPNFGDSFPTQLMQKGIGFYHDRIIYQIDDSANREAELSKSKRIIDEVIEEIVECIVSQEGLDEESKEELHEFFQIYSICVELPEEESPILGVSPYLDHIESEVRFSSSKKRDVIFELFNNNEKVKDMYLTKDLQNWQLQYDGNKEIKNIPNICKNQIVEAEKSQKKSCYYAVVQADGDRMGKVLEKMSGDKVGEFSKKCLNYAANSVEAILGYGGVVIYAGGDDLLFIAPVESTDAEDKTKKKNILELVHEICGYFDEQFKDICNGEEKPSLSFGISIQYEKFPLNEALKNAQKLLFGDAKSKRDSLVLNLRKHSGQSCRLFIEHLSASSLLTEISDRANSGKDGELVQSVLTHIRQFKALFDVAGEKAEKDLFKNLFENVFDSEKAHRQNGQLNMHLMNLESLLNSVISSGYTMDMYMEILKYIKFFSEAKGEQE